VQLLGEHNLRNISAIVALAEMLGIDDEVLHQTVKDFQPVRHRLQFVGTFRGIDFYDDAISTTPESTIAALDALGDRVETIFLGGLDRGYDFSTLVEKIKKSQIKQIVFFPESGEKIAEMLGVSRLSDAPLIEKYLHTASMEEAVRFAYEHTSSGKVCLLSTASPSYSVWKNFEEKGELFQEWVKKLGK
jgi:UDP-N-acetylmuramoylalanine--D-glutamate ligase